MVENLNLVPMENVSRRILLLRGRRVMLDADLADLYGVTTKRLNEQVRRNCGRFPPDFLFRLTKKEKAEVVANCDHLAQLKFSHALPNAFTEHGAVMAASVLNTDRAVEMSVFVVRAFVQMRRFLVGQKNILKRLEAVERQVGEHDHAIRILLQTFRELMTQPAPPRGRMGFRRPK